MKYQLFLIVLSCLLVQATSSWVDPDSSPSVYEVTSPSERKQFQLVFSDEFNIPGRSFADGSDPRWTAMNKNDYTNDALQYYRDTLVSTMNGYLNITTVHQDIVFDAYSSTDPKATISSMTKSYQSGMIQSWNKFCFTGGIIEISAQLPGKYNIGGLWPAVWLLGNLARATYVGSSNNIWPWSYNVCKRATQNQQRISACNLVNHYDMQANLGRGAPEIDILEIMAGVEKLENTPVNKPYLSSSLQVSPGVSPYRPTTGSPPVDGAGWYRDGISYGQNTSLNIFFYGETLDSPNGAKYDYNADAISGNTNIGETHFTSFHNYTLEWKSGVAGYIKWYIDGNFIHSIEASALNTTGAIMPEEPMYILLNTAMSSNWGFEPPAGCDPCYDCGRSECACACPSNLCDNFPAAFLIDYVRVYQDSTNPEQTVGCSPDSHPTAAYIKGNQPMYMNDPPLPGEVAPLVPVVTGGGVCHDRSECGNGNANMGSCISGVCVCSTGFTGPTCLASVGFDDVVYSNLDDDISTYGIQSPELQDPIIALFVTSMLGLVGVVAYKYYDDKQLRGDYRIHGMGRYQTADAGGGQGYISVVSERYNGGSSIGLR